MVYSFLAEVFKLTDTLTIQKAG